jgi:hypothetical protein
LILPASIRRRIVISLTPPIYLQAGLIFSAPTGPPITSLTRFCFGMVVLVAGCFRCNRTT